MAPRAEFENLGRTLTGVSIAQKNWLEDLAGSYSPEGPADLQSILDHVNLGMIRHSGTDRVWTARFGSVPRIFVVTDDMPLLVQSLSALVESCGARISGLDHPILAVRRDGSGNLLDIVLDESAAVYALEESWIHVSLSEDTSEDVLAAIGAALPTVLRDVRQVSGDHTMMLDQLTQLADSLPQQGITVEFSNTSRLLRWMAEENFVLLGYRAYDLDSAGQWWQDSSSGLGVLRGNTPEPIPLMGQPTAETSLLVVAQSPQPATVGASRYPYVVVVRDKDSRGIPRREHRFLGTFPVSAVYENILDIPVIAERTLEIVARSGVSLGAHSGQQILDVLSGLPRPELFSYDLETLHRIALSVLSIEARNNLRLFLQYDPLGQRVLAWIRLPQDRYTTSVRLAMHDVLLRECGGTRIDYTARVTESAVAWVFFTVRGPFGQDAQPDCSEGNQERIQALLAEQTRTWADRLAEKTGLTPSVAQWYATALPLSYQEAFSPARAVEDVTILEGLSEQGMKVHIEDAEPFEDERAEAILVLYVTGEPVTISKILPLLASLGITVLFEKPHELRRSDGAKCWIYQFGIQVEDRSQAEKARLSDSQTRTQLVTAMEALWNGQAEADPLGVLTLEAGLTWREVSLLRAYAQYLRQLDFPYPVSHIRRVLVRYADTASVLIQLFNATLNPAESSESARDEALSTLRKAIASVISLDEDRVLQAYVDLIECTVRTNFFRAHKEPGEQEGPEVRVISLKITPRALAGLSLKNIPKPIPEFEVFVSSPRVEGVHLRFGKVARGGIRWSDRISDFRTEILGLAKAQTAKNAVIVPVGAKGGFVVKRSIPQEEFREEGVACYTMFISGLLDITDNIDPQTKKIIPPRDVVRRDSDDPYLVVAADKGTATFSDIANGIAQEYSFWLGDAFASGGSVGYDHKAMGITARGAWESVKRHFWELGIDTQETDFTVVGIGDMSGDVFGNGMLCSPHIRLVAAFDHRHIFLDPTPDSAESFQERTRLFSLPRSSWKEYDPSLISEGGGVWERSAKSVPLSSQVRVALGLSEEILELSPPELIRCILKAPVDLLWNGGIGTYIKSSEQTSGDVGDKSNDEVRIDGCDVRARVVGEGGNLGVTQRGRIEFARHGGHINTDAIDNSAGVDCSDHEVNIKILLSQLEAAGQLPEDQRRLLLESLTDEVADLVLADNIAQNKEIGLGRRTATKYIDVHTRQIAQLAESGRLDRDVEFLPTAEELEELANQGLGLSSPELSVLLAYAKLNIKQELLDSDVPDSDFFAPKLRAYFPQGIGKEAEARVSTHAMHRQIVATQLANDIVDIGGTTFAFRMTEEAGVFDSDVARAFSAAVEIFDIRSLLDSIRHHEISAEAADQILLVVRRLLDRAGRWLVANRPQPLAIRSEITRYGPEVQQWKEKLPEWLQGDDRARYEAGVAELRSAGASPEFASRVARVIYEFRLLDIVDIAELKERSPHEVAELYFRLSSELGVSRVLNLATLLPVKDQWQVKARSALREELYGSLRALTLDVLTNSDPEEPVEEQIADWQARNTTRVNRAQAALEDVFDSVSRTGSLDVGDNNLAAVSVATRWVRSLVRGAV